MEERFVTDQNEIENLLMCCSDDFFDQNLNNESTIKMLAQKYSKFGNVLEIEGGSEQQIYGCIAYYANDMKNAVAYISMIVVRKMFQRMGVGKKLLNSMMDDCKMRRVSEIRLEVDDRNTNAIAFYMKNGFQRIEEASTYTSYYSIKL